MICPPCRSAGNGIAQHPGHKDIRHTSQELHKSCKGGTWCDCQHKTEALVKKNA